MSLTTDELYLVRRKVGSSPSDAVLNATFDRLGSVDQVVAEVLETRLADLAAQPDSFSIPGEYAQSTSGQLTALERQVQRAVAGRSLRLVRTDDSR